MSTLWYVTEATKINSCLLFCLLSPLIFLFIYVFWTVVNYSSRLVENNCQGSMFWRKMPYMYSGSIACRFYPDQARINVTSKQSILLLECENVQGLRMSCFVLAACLQLPAILALFSNPLRIGTLCKMDRYASVITYPGYQCINVFFSFVSYFCSGKALHRTSMDFISLSLCTWIWPYISPLCTQ